MNRRMYGMAPGGRMGLDRAANRRRVIWRQQRNRQQRSKPQPAQERIVVEFADRGRTGDADSSTRCASPFDSAQGKAE